MRSRYKPTDRVLYKSFIYIVDSYYWDEEKEEFVYQIHGNKCEANVKYADEHELDFAGYCFMD